MIIIVLPSVSTVASKRDNNHFHLRFLKGGILCPSLYGDLEAVLMGCFSEKLFKFFSSGLNRLMHSPEIRTLLPRDFPD